MIIESQTSQVVEAIEYANVSIQCKADAHPRATITWRRDDGSPIKLRGGQKQTDNHGTANFDNDNISGNSFSFLLSIFQPVLDAFQLIFI